VTVRPNSDANVIRVAGWAADIPIDGYVELDAVSDDSAEPT